MLKLWRSIQFPLLSPDDNTGLGGGGDKESIINFLAADDDKEPEVIDLKPEKPVKETEKAGDDTPPDTDDDKDTDKDEETDDEDEEVDELTELEDELEGPTDEQLELVTPVRRQEILKKYPKLFKDFPYLEKAYYREQQFTELLPTIDDAKEAVAAKQTLDNFESDILAGNTQKLLQAVQKGNKAGFNKLVNNYLPNLRAVDEKAYFHVISNVVKHTVAAMYGDGKENDNEDLQNAAIALNKFVFGTTKYTPAQNLDDSDADNPGDRKSQELAEKERKFNEQRLSTARTELKGKTDNVLKNTVLQHIDPKNSMSDYVKKNASRDALETLNGLIDRDARFKVLIDRLWQRAVEKNYDKTSIDAVRSAILSKAKTLLPAVIKRARNEALRGIGKRVKDDSEDTENNDSGKGPKKEKTRTTTSSETPRRGKITSAKDIPAGMSSLEFLNSD